VVRQFIPLQVPEHFKQHQQYQQQRYS
jgi:hypothetical protein